MHKNTQIYRHAYTNRQTDKHTRKDSHTNKGLHTHTHTDRHPLWYTQRTPKHTGLARTLLFIPPAQQSFVLQDVDSYKKGIYYVYMWGQRTTGLCSIPPAGRFLRTAPNEWWIGRMNERTRACMNAWMTRWVDKWISEFEGCQTHLLMNSNNICIHNTFTDL